MLELPGSSPVLRCQRRNISLRSLLKILVVVKGSAPCHRLPRTAYVCRKNSLIIHHENCWYKPFILLYVLLTGRETKFYDRWFWLECLLRRWQPFLFLVIFVGQDVILCMYYRRLIFKKASHFLRTVNYVEWVIILKSSVSNTYSGPT